MMAETRHSDDTKRKRSTPATSVATVQQLDPHELLNVKQAAHVLKIGEAYCWRLVRKGDPDRGVPQLPSRRLGRRVLIQRADLDTFVGQLPWAHVE